MDSSINKIDARDRVERNNSESVSKRRIYFKRSFIII